MEQDFDWNNAAELKPKGYCEIQNETLGLVFHGPIEKLIVEENAVDIHLKWVAQMSLPGLPDFGKWVKAPDEYKVITFPNLVIPFIVESTSEKGKRIRFGINIIYLEPQEEIDDRIFKVIGEYPPVSPGTRVKTTRENKALLGDWMPEAVAARKWGIEGTVIGHHDSHGLCYEVQHKDGSKAYYDPSEFELIKQ